MTRSYPDSGIALIIGAGPAGLTAAYEIATRTSLKPIVVESTSNVGGISQTAIHNGNRIDFGGHRFFSKSRRVMDWWLDRLPLENSAQGQDVSITYQRQSTDINPAKFADPNETDRVMLVRNRLSRILYEGNLYDYPISLSKNTISNLGVMRMAKIGASYATSQLRPIKPEESLEDFFINRFGRELYGTFFRDYTEKVWGIPCTEISSDWGAQRIKGISLMKVLTSALSRPFKSKSSVHQENVETSLIERFLYPKYGPGQMWEVVAEDLEKLGGEVRMNTECTGMTLSGDSVSNVTLKDTLTGEESQIKPDIVISTMPVDNLVRSFGSVVPTSVQSVADGLLFRHFITVGVLAKRMQLGPSRKNQDDEIPKDNWVYIQDSGVNIGRLQIFNNWSPWLVSDPKLPWVGCEFFTGDGDQLWESSNDQMRDMAIKELNSLSIISKDDVLDSTVLRMPKSYPAYFGTWKDFGVIREWADGINNLFMVGRNGMHRYNNQDHSMITAMTVVDNLLDDRSNKSNIWNVNTEQDYHEDSE